ncbi:MAG TPA: ABC transporter substrate-binding protein [Chloroflexota bacterium]|nr:ABC transporter substrate-binding protein [Chloroflexota bacterium]
MTSLRRWSLAFAVSAALVSCAGVPTASEPPAIPTSEAPANTATPVNPEGPLPIKIGIIEPLTGQMATAGVDNVDGFRLYLASIHHTVSGRTIEPEVVDSEANAETALAKAKALVESQHVSLLMGLETGSECAAVVEYANQQRLPVAITGDCGVQNLPPGRFTTRFTYAPSGEVDTAADWAAKNSFGRAILITSDDQRGIETSDAFASAFISRGGRIVQELHPPVGTADFGPYLAQMNREADVVVVWLAGTDGAPFIGQYPANGPPIVDLFGQLSQFGAKAVGMVGVSTYIDNFDSPGNRQFVKAWRATYPGSPVTNEASAGYVAGQVLDAAVKRTGGKVEDSSAFMQALYHTDVETVKGRVRLDGSHDVVQSSYVYRLAKQGSGYVNQLLQTYTNVGRDWDRTPEQLATFQFGAYKGKWVGMTKDQLGNVVTRRSLYQFFGSSEMR